MYKLSKGHDDVWKTLLLATSNKGKAAEFRTLLGDEIRVLSLAGVSVQMPEETGESFREIAEVKALSAAAQSGLTVLADDSGLVVDAIGGRPGVRSARFAGPDATDAENRSKLLSELKSSGRTDRTARFVCALSVATPDGDVWTELGVLEGKIGDHERGASGFGYDRLFVTASGRTLAELSPAEKNAISHRGEAMRRALPRIRRLIAGTDETSSLARRQGQES